MESEDIWRAYQLGLKVCKVLFGSPYGFYLGSRTVHYTKPKGFHRLGIYLRRYCLLLYSAICIINISAPVLFHVALLKNFNSIGINLLLGVIFGAFCIPSYHLCFNPSGSYGIINRLHPIKSALAGVLKATPEEVNLSVVRFIGFCLRLLIVQTICLGTMGAIFIVYFELDPLGPSFDVLFSLLSINESFRCILKLVLRYGALVCAIAEAACSSMLYIPGGFMMVVTLNNSISTICQLIGTNSVSISWKGFLFNPFALKTIRIYKMIQVYLAFSEPLFYTEIPVLVSCGSLVAVICNFATIKLYDKVELPVYICAPIISTFVFIIILTLVPQAYNVYEKCRVYRNLLNSTGKSKVQKRVIKSLKILGLKCSFFIMTSSVRTKMVECIMYYTMTLLISVNSSS